MSADSTAPDLSDAELIAELQAKIAQLEELVANANDIIYTHDLQGRFTWINRIGEETFGYKLPEDFGIRIADVVAPDYLERAQESVRIKLAGQDRNTPYELVCVARDGTRIWIEVSTRVVKNRHGDVVGIQGIARDITERKKSEELIRYQALHDQLTGLPNRRLFEDRLAHAIRRARRGGESVAVLFGDLDRFKTINDGLGHQVGDLVIQAVAKKIEKNLRDADTVSRRSGDEFTILLPHVKRPQDVARFARRLLKEFDAPLYVGEARHKVYASMSLGVSLFPADSEDADELIKFADLAMYRAKALGGNCFEFYRREMHESAMRRLGLEGEVRTALVEDAFLMRYRPRRAVADRTILGVESHIALRRSDGTIAPAGEVIPICEETGLIAQVDAWALRTACREACGARAMADPRVQLAVPVSTRSFSDGRFVDAVEDAVSESGFDPTRLVLQVTNATELGRTDMALEALTELRAMGIHLALENFGGGQCALSEIRRLPIEVLLVHRQFAEGLAHDARAEAIMQGIVEMGRQMDITVLAKGVRDERQRERLAAIGCHGYQGELAGEPMTMDELAAELGV